MAAKSKPVETLTVADLGIDAAQVGAAGARQEITRWPTPRPARPARSSSTRVTGSPAGHRIPRATEGPLGPVGEQAHMSVDKIWVLAEVADGAPITTSLELSPQPRALAGTVEAVAYGDATASVAGTLGEYGVTTVHDVGDLGGSLPGVPVPPPSPPPWPPARPRRHPVPRHLRRPRHRRPPVGQARPPGADQRGRPLARSTAAWCPSTPSSAAARCSRPPSPARARRSSWSGPSRSPPSRRAERPAAVVAAPGPGHRRDRRGQDRRPPRRGADRTQTRRGRRRGVGRPRPGREGPVRPHRGAGHPAQGGGRGQPGHRRRRVGALLPPGRADRQDGQAHRVCGLRDLRAPPSTWWA